MKEDRGSFERIFFDRNNITVWYTYLPYVARGIGGMIVPRRKMLLAHTISQGEKECLRADAVLKQCRAGVEIL